ncbi:unnamed protein product [Orchesella dallaii]|uniref:Uncharacterized protein n=1 Tax=Orchesella dallaii TaxID=48710 RepID=A0ABP1RYS1_9HEXA
MSREIALKATRSFIPPPRQPVKRLPPDVPRSPSQLAINKLIEEKRQRILEFQESQGDIHAQQQYQEQAPYHYETGEATRDNVDSPSLRGSLEEAGGVPAPPNRDRVDRFGNPVRQCIIFLGVGFICMILFIIFAFALPITTVNFFSERF